MQRDYGDVSAEYAALRSGTGYVEGFSDIVWLGGADAVSFIDGQVSQDVASMTEGTTARSFLLTPRGKLVALLWVLRGAETVGLVVDRGYGSAVVDHLETFKFRVDADLTIDESSTLEVWGPRLIKAAERAGIDGGAGWNQNPTRVAALLQGPVLERLVVRGEEDAAAVADVRPAGRIAADTVRVEAGEPVMGVDVDESTIPQETGLVPDAVSFTKGCYVGQELVARIDSRGRVNRRLMGIRVSENVVPPVGAEIVADGRAVGRVSTVGESLAARAPVAMAMLRREVEAGSSVHLEWESAAVASQVEALPIDDFAETSHSSNTQGRG